MQWRELSGAGIIWVLVFSLGIIVSPVGGAEVQGSAQGENQVSEMVNLLFIHHSCGGMLLADPGEKTDGAKGSGERCIYGSHPLGGGLRTLLNESGFQVNELSYESKLGEDTDIEHWRGKFANHMDELLRTGKQDIMLPEGETNAIVVFKSCYPNNDYVGLGEEPGDPDSCERTVANSKASYNSLLPLFKQHPDVLFVAFTPPPRAEPKPKCWKEKITFLFKKKPKDADYARLFNGWLADENYGWLAGYDGENVVVFDYYDILTGGGESNWSRYPTLDGHNSHPSMDGNQKAAQIFIPFLKEAWEGCQ